MPDTTCHMSISLDGFVAGPDQSREHPLGKRGRELHGWHLGDERANEADATAERPAEVPEKFWDAAKGAVRVDALLKSYRELERRLSQRAGPTPT